MDPSSTSSNNRQPKYSGTRQFRPLEVKAGLHVYLYEASRIALDSVRTPKQMLTVKLSDLEIDIIRQLNAPALQQVWDMAFEHYQVTRNETLIEQLRLYGGIRNIRSLLLSAYLDTNNTTGAHVVLGDVERWVFYNIFKADARLLNSLATRKSDVLVHPYCLPITCDCMRRHSELLATFAFRPGQGRRGPRSYLGLLARYALYARFGETFGGTSLKPQGKLCYPAPKEWEIDPFIRVFPDACDPDVNDSRDAEFEASLKMLPEELHAKARAQWRTPTWSQLTRESELCVHLNRDNWQKSFKSGVGVTLMLTDNSLPVPTPTLAALHRTRRTAYLASTVVSAPSELASPPPPSPFWRRSAQETPDLSAQDAPGLPALAQSTPTPPPPPSPSTFAPQEPITDVEQVLRGIFSTMESP